MSVQLTAKQRILLKKARGEMSQMELSSRVGCASQMISMIESGVKQPSEALLNKIATALGLRFQVKTIVVLEPKPQKK